jgi:hypothetical protein
MVECKHGVPDDVVCDGCVYEVEKARADTIESLRAEVQRLKADALRLDWLEKMGNEPEGLLLHSQHSPTGRRGLGLGSVGRSLRQAVDDALVADEPAALAQTKGE